MSEGQTLTYPHHFRTHFTQCYCVFCVIACVFYTKYSRYMF